MRWNRGPQPSASDRLRAQRPIRAAAPPRDDGQPSLRSGICGYYDLVCSYYGNEVVAGQLEAGAQGTRRACSSYAGGHAIYTDDAVRLEMKRDVAAFVRARRRSSASAPSLRRHNRPSRAASRADGEARSTTQHQITIGGRTLRYTRAAGLLPIRVNETGEPHGHVFYVAYTAGRTTGHAPAAHVSLERRPRLELDAAAPGRLRPEAACRLDAAGGLRGMRARRTTRRRGSSTRTSSSSIRSGTGFSRPTRAEYGAEFYNTLGDIASIAEFIRVYLDAVRRVGRAALHRRRELRRVAGVRRRRSARAARHARGRRHADLRRHPGRAGDRR